MNDLNVETGDKVQISGWVMRNDSENTFLIRHDKKVNVEILEKKFQKGDIVVCDDDGRVGQVETVDRHQSYLLQVFDGMVWLNSFSGLRRATEKEKSEFRLKMQEKQDRIDAAEFEALVSRMSARQIFKSFKEMLETASSKLKDEPKIDSEEKKIENPKEEKILNTEIKQELQQHAPAVETASKKLVAKKKWNEIEFIACMYCGSCNSSHCVKSLRSNEARFWVSCNDCHCCFEESFFE